LQARENPERGRKKLKLGSKLKFATMHLLEIKARIPLILRKVADQNVEEKSLATATISLRKIPLSPPPLPSTDGSNQANIWDGLTDSPKIQIVPPLPALLSLSLHPSTTINAVTREISTRVTTEFERGWKEGIRVLWERRNRMGTSFMRSTTGEVKVRFLKFKDHQDEDKEDEGLEGLEDIKGEDTGMFFESASRDAPVLCVAGPDRNVEHTDRCGHSLAWNIWAD